MTGYGAPLVVIVAYGDPEHLRRCLNALDAPVGQVAVVDNGLSRVVEDLCSEHGVTYVKPPFNLGFAAGVNLGCQLRGDRDVLLLNPDAIFGWTDVLRMQAKLHEVAQRAAVSPRLVRPDGSLEPPSWPIPSPSSVWADALGLGRWHRGPRFLTGAVLILRNEALREVGEFDERFFLYAEESDWQLRALRAGWSLDLVLEVTAVHVGGATSSSESTRSGHSHRSAQLFALKWYGPRGAALIRLATLVGAVRRSVTGGRAGRVESLATARACLRRMA